MLKFIFCNCTFSFSNTNPIDNICISELFIHFPFSCCLSLMFLSSILSNKTFSPQLSISYLVRYCFVALSICILVILYFILIYVEKFKFDKCFNFLILFHISIDIFLLIVILIHDYTVKDFECFHYFRLYGLFLYVYNIIGYLFSLFFYLHSTISLFSLSLIVNILLSSHILSHYVKIKLENHIPEFDFTPLRYFSVDNLLFGNVWLLIENGVNNTLSSIDYFLPINSELSPSGFCVPFTNFRGFCSILRLFPKQIVLISLIKLFCLSTSLIYPIILLHFVNFLINPNSDLKFGLLILGVFICNSVILGLSSVYYNYFNTKLGLNLKSKLTPALLNEVLNIPFIKQNDCHHGQLLDYLTSDIDRIVNFFPSIQEFWSMPVQIIISTMLLYQQVGVASFGGIVFIIILIPLNKLLANKISSYSLFFMQNKDERLKIFTDFLQNVMGIKIGCYENFYYKEILEKRKQELKYLRRQKYLDALCVIFWAICPVVICALTFTIYVFLGNEISATKVLTSLALFNLLIGPMNALPWVINGVIEAMISLKRINSISNNSIKTSTYSIPYDILSHSNSLITISEVDFSWNSKSESQDIDKIILFKNISMDIKENEYIGIIGNVGSGKTSFLLAILQEMNNDNGSFKLSESIKDSSIAFVSQKSWVVKKSIKENIIMFEPFDQKWYKMVIEACGLDVDFSCLKNGDDTQIADHGNSLSGGQKSRICLARALYQRSKLYLLDDPLSSLDGNVSQLIIEKVLSQLLRHTAVIMTTHNVQYFLKFKDNIRVPDKIFSIDNGTLTQVDSGSDLSNLSTNDLKENAQLSLLENNVEVKSEDSPPIKQEHMEIGTIKFNIYSSYLQAIGYFLTVIIFTSLLLMQGTKNFSEYWLSLWTSTNETRKNNNQTITFILLSNFPISLSERSPLRLVYINENFKYFLTIYLIAVCLNFLFSIIRAFSFAYGGIKASYYVHNKLLSVLMRARLQFFEVVPQGQILNRFTSDLSTIDDNLPFVTNIFLANIFTCIGSLIVVSVSLPFVIIVILPIIYFCYYFQFFYRITSRAVKRMISINRSPLYSHFSEMIEGMILIRNFKLINKFIEANNNLLANLIQCEFSALLLSSWLAIRLQIMGIAFVIFVIAVSLLANHFTNIDKGLIGLACVYSFSLANLLSGVITYATESEKEFIAVERCFEYIFSKCDQNIISEFKNDNSENIMFDSPQFCLSLLDKGSVEFENVYLRYIPGGEFALSNINFKIKSGQKVGVIGRTGSGKSSLIRILFRLAAYEKELLDNKHLTGYYGKVLINGTNILDYNLRDLRFSLSAMAQESLVFSGSIRQNLDPSGDHTDEELLSVVSKLHFTKYFSDFQTDGSFNLNGFISNQGRELSFGQHQLLCLGRIMLSQNNIICLDEPSAYLDPYTENVIENIILNDFNGRTVFIIGHRLPMLMRICDSFLIMEYGKVVEYGSKSSLLKMNNSYLSQSVKL